MGNRQLTIFKVSGNSMNPLLHDGDRISVMPVPKYKIGDIVVTVHPIQTDLTIIKRIEWIAPDGRIQLRGANPNGSTDNFGLVTPEKIIGKMIAKLD
ncbi:S26 family signal peptidase [Candidatus Peregrinibacteria bacterium]|nr:S26 family signal peptidase [Candidatus Peregrinibacteria bacterium]